MEKLNTYFLVRALKNGDLSSLEKLYKLYYSKIFSFARQFDDHTLDADDFVQQTFIQLWEKKDLLKEDVLIDKQLFIICRNLCLNHIKRQKKFSIPFPDFLNSVPAEAEEDKDDHTAAELYNLIDKLPSKRKKIFILHKLHNLTYQEIADSLNISKKTIANHIYLANTFIRQELHK